MSRTRLNDQLDMHKRHRSSSHATSPPTSSRVLPLGIVTPLPPTRSRHLPNAPSTTPPPLSTLPTRGRRRVARAALTAATTLLHSAPTHPPPTPHPPSCSDHCVHGVGGPATTSIASPRRSLKPSACVAKVAAPAAPLSVCPFVGRSPFFDALVATIKQKRESCPLHSLIQQSSCSFTYQRSVQWVTVGCHSVLPRTQRALPLFKHYKRANTIAT